MKEITLPQLYDLAKSMHYSDFEQHVKSYLTGKPLTVVIDCKVVLTKKI